MRNRFRPIRAVLLAAILLGTPLAMIAADRPPNQSPAGKAVKEQVQPKRPPVDPKWLDSQLKALDRALLDELIGYAPPPFTEDLVWVGSDPLTWESLRGKVVVLQSWTRKSGAASRLPARVARALKDVDSNSLVIIALHTPDGADSVDKYLERKSMDLPVAVDGKGDFCDSLGVYTRPVNVIIDRQGAVRYAGLNSKSLQAAVAALVDEEHDPSIAPPVRPVDTEVAGAEFPPITGKVTGARDVRGQVAPEFYAEKWMTQRADPRGKVVMIDFWATWCPPCRASIPHINELANRYGNQVCFIGLSDESPRKFEEGLRDNDLKLRHFGYPVAVDRQGRMAKQMGIATIPHAIVLSSDWVVRWQGHPRSLTAETLDQIIKADAAAGGGGGGLDAYRRRWTRE